MAGGFDSTAFSTGLLDSVNNQYAQQRANQQIGDKDQYNAFMEASKEYDTAKNQQKDQQAKVDALANVISGGKPDAAAYATARDAVELGYTGQEHLPYVMEAYKNTQKMATDDPENWTGVKPQQTSAYQADAAKFGPDPVQDSNPDQTRTIRKFGNSMPQDQIEDIRNHNLQRPYQNLPGAAWGSAEDTKNRLTQEQTASSEKGRIQAESSPEALALKQKQAQAAVSGQMGAYGYTMDENGQPVPQGTGPTPKDIQGAANTNNQVQSAQPQSGVNQGQQGQNPLAVPSQQLQPQPLGQAQVPSQPPASNAGISLSGPPPSQNPTTGGTQPQQPNPQQFDVNMQNQPKPQTAQAAIPVSQQPQSYPAMPKTQLGSALDFKTLETQGSLNSSALDRLTPQDAAYVRAMVAGQRTPIPAFAGARNAHTQMLLQAATAYDPSYTDGRFAARNKFLSGDTANNIGYLNTAYNHMGLLQEAGDAMKNGDLPSMNKIANAFGVQEGKSAPVVYDNIKHYVASEMNRFYSGGHPNLASLDQISSSIDKAQSPEQMNGVMSINLRLLDGAADRFNNQYQEIMGNTYTPTGFLSKTAQNVRDQLEQTTNSRLPGNTQNKPTQNIAPQTQDVLSKFGLQ